MSLLFSKKFLWFLIITAISLVSIIVGQNFLKGEPAVAKEFTSVSRGDVSTIVTVSGKIEAKNIANLSFPTIGTIQNVYKNEGDHVLKGEVLASITQDSALGEYNAAVQNLTFLKLTKDELIRGPVESNRAVTETKVQIANNDVLRIEKEQELIVKNSLETLLSTGLEAIPLNNTVDDIPPIITGNYFCKEEGEYIISIFGSNSPTNYSYKLSGLEDGTFVAYTDTSDPLGSCGLLIKFDKTKTYRSGDWVVSIPNKRSSSYLTNRNNYTLALQQQANTISASKQALDLARSTKEDTDASPSPESLNKVNANIAQAEALLAISEAKIADYTIRAPFDGMISEQNIKIGETATQDKGITILKVGLYDIKARIPEVDIANIQVGNEVIVSFDAKPLDLLSGTITYISPNSTEVDGVAYYESTLTLLDSPDWMRVGLNADVKIIIQQKKNVLRLPESFILTDGDKKYVLTQNITKDDIVQVPVETGLFGNNGYVEILNLPEDYETILP